MYILLKLNSPNSLMSDVVQKTSITTKRWRGGRGITESKETRQKYGSGCRMFLFVILNTSMNICIHSLPFFCQPEYIHNCIHHFFLKNKCISISIRSLLSTHTYLYSSKNVFFFILKFFLDIFNHNFNIHKHIYLFNFKCDNIDIFKYQS